MNATDHMLRLDDILGLLVGQAMLAPPAFDLVPPAIKRLGFDLVLFGFPDFHHVFKDMTDIADNPDIDRNVFVDRALINIDLDFLRTRREEIKVAGHAVIKSCTNRNHHIAIVHGHVRFVRTMHAQHAKILFIRSRIGTKPHQRQRDRNTGQTGEFRQDLAGLAAGIDDATTAIQDRLFRRCQQFECFLDLTTVAFDNRVIGAVLNL